MLTIHSARREEHKERHRSEFRYGSLTRSVTLPERADTGHLRARYGRGILWVTLPVPNAKAECRGIAISHG